MVRPVFLLRGKRSHLFALWGQVAYRIGGRGVAGERESLAPAAAEILFAARAACAWFFHPGGAAEGIESGGIDPDIGERMLAYVPEFQVRDAFRRVAWKDLAGRRHVERAPSPSAHAWLWIARVIIRHDGIDDDPAVMAVAQLLDLLYGARDLFAARHQHGAIFQRPTIILHMR